MKKVIPFLVIALFANVFAYGQDSIKKTVHWSTELDLNLSGTSISLGTLYPKYPAALTAIKFRYMICENLYLRLSGGLNITNTYLPIADTRDTLGGSGSNISKTTAWMLIPGLEWHFNLNHHLKPYFGIEAGYGTRSTSINDVNSLGFNYQPGYGETQASTSYSYSIDLLFGADYYIGRRFYFGAEAGIANEWVHTGKTHETYSSPLYAGNVVVRSITTSSDIAPYDNFYSYISFVPGIRIGYSF